MNNMNFEERLKRAIGIKEDRKPKAGIWYYLYLKPKWKLWHYTYTEQSRNISHLEAWQILAEDVAKHYKITSKDVIDEMKELAYGFPRGRVDSTEGLGLSNQGNRWFIFHGDDFPLSKDGEIKKIVGLFDLSQQMMAGMVEIKEVDHERMDPNHTERLSEMLRVES